MKNFVLPEDHRPYIDRYFLRSKEILEKENLNPMVKAQVFIRRGNCNVYGIDEAIAILTKYGDIKTSGEIWALKEGDYFEDKEILMTIKAPIQSIIDLETMYLGVLSRDTTLNNGGSLPNSKKIQERMSQIVELVDDRPVSYFGARHWGWEYDYLIATACKNAGAANCSTDEGAKGWGERARGIGTINHALETVYHWQCGLDRAVVEATKAFDKHIDKSVPRVALIDYANKEITDTLNVYKEVPSLAGVRIDTCGENYMETAPQDKVSDRGVSLSGVVEFNNCLMERAIRNDIKIILSSGFGNVDKVKSFVDYEKRENVRLFDGLGVGGVFESRLATMDIIEVEGQEIHKVGREPRNNDRLERVL